MTIIGRIHHTVEIKKDDLHGFLGLYLDSLKMSW